MTALPDTRWKEASPAARATSAKVTPGAAAGEGGGTTTVGGRGRPSSASTQEGQAERDGGSHEKWPLASLAGVGPRVEGVLVGLPLLLDQLLDPGERHLCLP